MDLGLGDECVKGREEGHGSGEAKNKLETLEERKMVNLDCLMLNTRSGLYFKFCHTCVH